MLCNRCGKENEAEDLFCTECGNSLRATEKTSELNTPKKTNQFLKKINDRIEILGDEKINQYLSVIMMIVMIAIKILGFIVTALLITVLNGYLVYYHYKTNAKVNIKMIAWSVAVFIVGLLISI